MISMRPWSSTLLRLVPPMIAREAISSKILKYLGTHFQHANCLALTTIKLLSFSLAIILLSSRNKLPKSQKLKKPQQKSKLVQNKINQRQVIRLWSKTSLMDKVRLHKHNQLRKKLKILKINQAKSQRKVRVWNKTNPNMRQANSKRRPRSGSLRKKLNL